MKKHIIFLTIVLLLGPAPWVNARSFILLSSLPATVGNLKFLKLEPNAVDPTEDCTTAGLVGLHSIGYPPSIWICDGTEWDLTSVWQRSPAPNGPNIHLRSFWFSSGIEKVGIGTSTPEFKLTIENAGEILAKGAFGSGSTLITAGAGTRLIWYPKKSALLAGTVSGTQWDDGNIHTFTVAFGQDNAAKINHSSILGGLGNTINEVAVGDLGAYSVISGGRNNSTSGSYSVIGGGQDNIIDAEAPGWNTIGGGFSNWIRPYVSGSTIAGGVNNETAEASGFDTISGGANNLIRDYGTTSDSYNTIAGGNGNMIRGGTVVTHNTIAGGGGNDISDGAYSIISGGATNVASGNYNTIAGGFANQATNSYSTISGGRLNQANGQHSSITGGWGNSIGLAGGGQSASILGGYNNLIGGATAGGAYSVILGGDSNAVEGDYSLAAGRNMKVGALADGTFLFGGNATTLSTNTPNSAIFAISGNMGIGQSAAALAPPSKLYVDGDMRARLTDLPNGVDPNVVPAYFNFRDYQVGYDVAELFDATETVQVGELVEISDEDGVKLQRTQNAYSKRVVGVVSGAPAILFEGQELVIAPKPGEFVEGNKPPVALAGRVPVKVSTENGWIKRGDLLTSSSTPGHAMKATNHKQAFGAIVGKALEPFNGGKDGATTGMIKMIVNLQ